MTGKIRTLLFSTLYPSSARPVHGIFVETRLRELLKTGQVETKVVAPVPWFPFKHPRFGEYATFARTPLTENRNGIEVHHPRYLLLPRVGMNQAPYTLAKAALPVIRRLMAEGYDFDLIDAHYYYPDGVAAMFLAKALNKPFVVTARGTDLTLIPNYPKPRHLIQETAAAASASIGVCRALMDRLDALGAEPGKLNVFRNGVDTERFHVIDRGHARQELGLPGLDITLLLSAGHLIERKGHHLAIQALARCPQNTQLVIAGSGPEEHALKQLTQSLKLEERVHFVGQVPQTDLVWYFNAANVLLLCSTREGWPNVLLESMACGTPVVASRVDGVPEVVTAPAAGRLFQNHTVDSLFAALQDLLNAPPDRNSTRAYAEGFGWAPTSQAQIELFEKIMGK